ncbi:MAG: M1 family aminopeptidase [Gemmatimonadota bacterium]|nr:M1 family aminopeptidase [Gemmatimonadota bacterium]MDP7031446.1 M1 family aminopeptidase [Gemmatimonadota bacterium]
MNARIAPSVVLVASLLLSLSSGALAAPRPAWSGDHPRDRLLAGLRVPDARDPWSALRTGTEGARAHRGVLEGCPHDYDVLHYELNFSQVDISGTNLEGNTVVRFVSMASGLASVVLDLTSELTVYSVTEVGGSALAFTHASDALDITLAAAAGMGDTVSVDISYGGTPENEGGGGFGGFWFTPYPANAYSMGVGLYSDPPSMGKTWFPCYDWPCDKATVDIHVTVPLDLVAVANGLNTSVDSTATDHTWRWSHDFPTSTYLMAMSVAPYKALPDSDDARITYYHHPGYKKKSLVSFRFCDQMMAAFEARYGPYPFDKFAYMTTAKGDMEHQTCVSHKLALVDSTNNYDDILSHEMAHQWYGDCATYGDWRDIWLSEGFATYSEAVFREYRDGLAAYHSYVTSFLLNRVINSGVPDGVYDPTDKWGVTNYEKGACVLHMLRGVLDNDTLFWQVMTDYLAAHAYGNAVTADFIADASATVGQDMSWFFDPWCYGSGHPVYEYGWSSEAVGGGQHRVDAVIRQVQTTGTLFDMPVDFRVETASGDFDFSERISGAEETVSFVVPDAPTGFVVDPNDWILDEQSLAPTSVDFGPETTPALTLLAPRPNPFSGLTEIRYQLSARGETALEIVDVAGRRVRSLVAGVAQPGARKAYWDRRDDSGARVAPGVYWVRLAAPDGVMSRKLVVAD